MARVYSGQLVPGQSSSLMGFIWLPHFLATTDALGSYAAQERRAKLPDLFQMYGRDTGDWQGLAVGLALAHVPRLPDLAGVRGAPKGKVTGQYIVALLDGWRARNPAKSLAAAIQWAIKAGPLKGMKAEAVRRRYNLARSRKKLSTSN